MNLLFPLFSFMTGLFLAQQSYADRLKPFLAMVLARIFIPVVIIYNMIFYQPGSFSLMLFSFISAIILYSAFMILFKDRLGALCFSYVNMAWLGFPLAIAIFGPSVSPTIIALYIGGSIFGNIWAVTAVSSEPQSKMQILKKVMLSPPLVALVCAAILWFLGLQHSAYKNILDEVYTISKIGMTFAGMCILGMWLRHTKVKVEDLISSSKILSIKIIFGALLCGFTYLYIPIADMKQHIGAMFFLFFLPPAANIVALETHYQGTGISARYIASGTIVSCIVITIYGVALHVL